MLVEFICGVLFGVIAVFVSLLYLLTNSNGGNEQRKIPIDKTHVFQLPPELEKNIKEDSVGEQESCMTINFILCFLFHELRFSQRIRHWAIRKLSLELEEILSTTVLGKFFSNIAIQNINFGGNFPILKWVKTDKVKIHPVYKSISTLEVLLDVDYSGGFQFSVKAETHMKHSAFLSIKINSVKGIGRLHFTSDPYTHWSFSFVENPDISLSVDSQLYGKSFSQITSIISNQLKKSVRKKHTLPMYKIRYKPFFTRIVKSFLFNSMNASDASEAEIQGSLTVSLLDCKGLMPSLVDGKLSASVAIAESPWVAVYTDNYGAAFVIKDIVYIKRPYNEGGLDFELIQVNDFPVVGAISSCESSSNFFEPGDEILAIGGKHVSTVKSCLKYFKSSQPSKVLCRIRRKFPLITLSTKCNPSEISKSEEDKPPESNFKSTVERSLENNEATLQKEADKDSESDESHQESEEPLFESSKCSKYILDEENCSSMDSYYVFQDPAVLKSYSVSVTSSLAPTCNPIFRSKCDTIVEETSKFLNISVWSEKSNTGEGSNSSQSAQNSSPKKKGAISLNNIIFKDKIVVATISIPVTDIISDCLATGIGSFIKEYYLYPPEFSALEADEHELADHPSFEPSMCYGKIKIFFQFKSDDTDTKRADQVNKEDYAPLEIAEEASPALFAAQYDLNAHKFVKAQFTGPVSCDFCNKKIWLKDAFKCKLCNWKCHKKCHEKCINNTVCTGLTEDVVSLSSLAPTIMTSDADDKSQYDFNCQDNLSPEQEELPSSNARRRRTLTGLISAMQIKSSHIRRAGSASTLLSPNSPNYPSKSLPSSPQASPLHKRKEVNLVEFSKLKGTNPFSSLDDTDASDENISFLIDEITQYPIEELVPMAKESGKIAFQSFPLLERKVKLNHILNKLQEEVDALSRERVALNKEKTQGLMSPDAIRTIDNKLVSLEDKSQAMALLMLHYCSGLQHVQDLEESDKEKRSPTAEKTEELS